MRSLVFAVVVAVALLATVAQAQEEFDANGRELKKDADRYKSQSRYYINSMAQPARGEARAEAQPVFKSVQSAFSTWNASQTEDNLKDFHGKVQQLKKKRDAWRSAFRAGAKSKLWHEGAAIQKRFARAGIDANTYWTARGKKAWVKIVACGKKCWEAQKAAFMAVLAKFEAKVKALHDSDLELLTNEFGRTQGGKTWWQANGINQYKQCEKDPRNDWWDRCRRKYTRIRRKNWPAWKAAQDKADAAKKEALRLKRKAAHDKVVNNLKTAQKKRVARLRKKHADEVAMLKSVHAKRVKQIRKKHADRVAALKKQKADKLASLASAKAKAEKRANELQSQVRSLRDRVAIMKYQAKRGVEADKEAKIDRAEAVKHRRAAGYWRRRYNKAIAQLRKLYDSLGTHRKLRRIVGLFFPVVTQDPRPLPVRIAELQKHLQAVRAELATRTKASLTDLLTQRTNALARLQALHITALRRINAALESGHTISKVHLVRLKSWLRKIKLQIGRARSRAAAARKASATWAMTRAQLIRSSRALQKSLQLLQAMHARQLATQKQKKAAVKAAAAAAERRRAQRRRRRKEKWTKEREAKQNAQSSVQSARDKAKAAKALAQRRAACRNFRITYKRQIKKQLKVCKTMPVGKPAWTRCKTSLAQWKIDSLEKALNTCKGFPRNIAGIQQALKGARKFRSAIVKYKADHSSYSKCLARRQLWRNRIAKIDQKVRLLKRRNGQRNRSKINSLARRRSTAVGQLKRIRCKKPTAKQVVNHKH